MVITYEMLPPPLRELPVKERVHESIPLLEATRPDIMRETQHVA